DAGGGPGAHGRRLLPPVRPHPASGTGPVSALEVVILGCGSSGGVPRGDGDWGACDPAEPKNRRSRCSLLVRRSPDDPAGEATSVIIDTSPDLRQQALAAGLRPLDGGLYTHDHATHTHGIGHPRAFAMPTRRRVRRTSPA